MYLHNTNNIFSIHSETEFEQAALEIFHYQARYNTVYADYLQYLGKRTRNINTIHDIPFLPISFFKTHQITTGTNEVQKIFSSSGTTGIVTSRHYVTDLAVYKQSFVRAFELFYGSITNYVVLALLPAYLEREGSSLVYMADHLITMSGQQQSGFYLYNYHQLAEILQQLEQNQQPTLLLGVTFALLDLAEQYPMQLQNTIVMETGGMKGRRREMVREELHTILCNGLGVKKVHSEYGMTELLSQAYSSGDGIFQPPPWMRVLTRDTNDPFSYTLPNTTGGINVIDLANVNACSFIETQDLGRVFANGSFEVIGRFDNSDIRGCNLLVV